LFDAPIAGSGQTFDWQLLADKQIEQDYFIAGGLAVDNVAESKETFHPYALDVSSGVLSMLAAFILVVPIDHYFNSLPTDASVTGFAIISFLILAGTVLNSDHYSFDDAVYPITSAFYVGFGFQNLIAARLDSWEKVLFALFIVWATDIG
ncbi:phosphatidate cytidylyltransferase, partial [Klebsiella pneumoniae subsp. pneumoniae]|nr:phosphatidate cytidylyltransferase [Klebsiella pneumoniae subsp. pneumoniae]